MFEALQRERLRAGLALEKAAYDMGVPVEVLAKWESGEEEMRGADIIRVCRYYACSPDYLLGLVGSTGIPCNDGSLEVLL